MQVKTWLKRLSDDVPAHASWWKVNQNPNHKTLLGKYAPGLISARKENLNLNPSGEIDHTSSLVTFVYGVTIKTLQAIR